MNQSMYVIRFALLVFCTNLFSLLPAQITEAHRRADQKYRQAKEAFDHKLYVQAREGFSRALETKSLSEEREMSAYYYQAISALELFHADAEELMLAFLHDYPTSSYVNQAYLYLGQFFFQNRNYRKSEKYLESVKFRYLNDRRRKESQFQLGYSYFMNDKSDQAKGIFRKLKDDPSPYGTSARYYYAHIAYSDSNYAEALINFEALENDASFGRMVPYYLAHVYYYMDNYERMRELASEILKDEEAPRRAELAKLMADSYYREKNYKEAVHYFELFRDEGGRFQRSDHYELGFSYYNLENYSEAITSFNKITSGKDKFTQVAWYYLGDCYIQQGDKTAALNAFSAALDLLEDPEIREDAFYNYIKLNYDVGGLFRDVISSLQDFKHEYPNSQHLHKVNTLLASAYLSNRNYNRAAEALKEAGLRTMEQRLIYQKVTYFQGVQAFQTSRFTSAISHFEESRRYAVSQEYLARALYWAAESFYQLQQYEAAVDVYKEFQSSPQAFSTEIFPYSYYGLGYAAYKAGQLDESIRAFRMFVREKNISDGRKRDAMLRLADVQFLNRQFDNALESYEKVARDYPENNHYARFQQALCYGLTGKPEKKISLLDKLSRDAAGNSIAMDATLEKAATLIQVEEYQRSIDIYNRFVQDNPNHPSSPRAKLNMSLAHRNMDDNEKAALILRQIVRDYPNTPEAAEALAFGQSVYQSLDRMSDYVSWVQQSGMGDVNENQLDSALYFAGFDQYSTANYKKAVDGLSGYLKKFPRGIFLYHAKYYIADSHFRLNQFKEAEPYFEEIADQPGNTFYLRSISRLAAISHKTEDWHKASLRYQLLLQKTDRAEERITAENGLMQVAYHQRDWPQLEKYAEVILDRSAIDKRLEKEARWSLALSAHFQNKRPKADSLFAYFIENFEGEEAAMGRYYLATYHFEDEEWAQSKQGVYELIELYPGNTELRDRSLLLLARIFIEEKDYFQAEYSLDFVIQSSEEEDLKAKARQLKASLEELQKEKQEKEKTEEEEEEDDWTVDPGVENSQKETEEDEE